MILLSLGSHLSSKYGDKIQNLKHTLLHLEKAGLTIIKKSSIYETPSYPDQNMPKFVNMVILVKSNLSPEELMSLLINIEKKMERIRGKKNEPRTCDIDIIDYKNQVLDFNYKNLNLVIPHEKLSSRNFVLIPLQEIFPNWKHPKTKEIISSLIENLSTKDRKSILKIKKN
tara:strand:- start:1747 stop:2259 length:513 start_codon:yes stop_codon:yes gene_type:complete